METKLQFDALIVVISLTKSLIVTGCGQTLFTGLDGFVSSPNFPNHYSDNEYCTYSIRSPGPRSVFIGFTDFDVEASYDKVQVWCPDNNHGIQVFTGKDLTSLARQSSTFVTFRSCSLIQVLFTSDGSTTGRGFRLSFFWFNSATTSIPTTTRKTTTRTTTSPTTKPTTTTTTTTFQTTSLDYDESTGKSHDALDKIFVGLGPRMSALLILINSSLLAVSILVILILIIVCNRREKKRDFDKRTGLETCRTEASRGRSDEGYTLDPVDAVKRSESPAYEIEEEPNYTQIDPVDGDDNDDDETDYQNINQI